MKTDDPRAAVQVELNVENLEYITAAFCNETIVKSNERPEPAYYSDKSVKWNYKRSAFVAEFDGPEEKKYKQFKVETTDDWRAVGMEALEWLQAGAPDDWSDTTNGTDASGQALAAASHTTDGQEDSIEVASATHNTDGKDSDLEVDTVNYEDGSHEFVAASLGA